jgi:hypothetical protein
MSITSVFSVNRYGFLSNPESASNKRLLRQFEENFYLKRPLTETNLTSPPEFNGEKGLVSPNELSFGNTEGSQQVLIL